MRSLLKTELYKYTRSPFLLFAIAISAAAGFMFYGMSINDRLEVTAPAEYIIYMPIVLMLILIAFHIGSDSTSGALRNKLISGKKRKTVYLCYLISELFINLLILIIFQLPMLILRPGFLTSQLSTELIPIVIAGYLFTAVSLAAMFTFFSVLFSQKGVAVIICGAILLSGAILSKTLYGTLSLRPYIPQETVINR